MNTVVASVNNDSLSDNRIETAGQLIKEGNTVAFPTDTVYVVGANAFDEDAAAKILSLKGKTIDHPLTVYISDWDALGLIVKEIPTKAAALAERYWPGALAMIFRKNDKLSDAITAGMDTIAVRMPDHDIARGIIRLGGGCLAGSSANKAGRPGSVTAEHVLQDLNEKISLIIDAGDCKYGLESTILDMTKEPPMILRKGPVTKEMIEQVIGEVTVLTEEKEEDKKRMYAPDAEIRIVEGKDSMVVSTINELIREKEALGYKVGVLCTQETYPSYEGAQIRCLGSKMNPEECGANLYKALRELDQMKVDYIYAENFGTDQMNEVLMDRLEKASVQEILKINRYGVSKLNKILFVSDGATIMGPMAEGIAKKSLEKVGLQVACRGLVVLFPEPVNQKAEAVMISNGIRLEGYQSRQLEKEDMGEGCLVLTMYDKQKEKVLQEYPEQKSVYSIGEFTEMPMINNPYGKELPDYGKCFEEMTETIHKVIRKLMEERLI